MADTNIPPKVLEAIQRGNLIEAIKYIRQHKPQMGLAEAKAMIEAIQRQGAVPPLVQKAHDKVAAHAPGMHGHSAHPVPTSQMNPHVSPGEVPRSSSGAAFALVVVALVVVLAAAAYFGR
jgi:hypothetical protein